ncbi:MAG TPA: hypothetical protein PKD83_10365 [Ignavibacteria bacterium]|nr:hypothetical protein [Ignavibacteria bacterium]
MPETNTEKVIEPKLNDNFGNEYRENDEKFMNDEINWEEQKIDPLTREDFQIFAHSKNYHIKFFQNKHYDELLYGRKITKDEYDLQTYQNLLVFSFIMDNIMEGARILEIGKGDDYVINHFRFQRECYRLENPELLLKDISEIASNSSPLTNISEVKTINGIPADYFDFIYSNSGFEDIKSDDQGHKTILGNINKMLKKSGYALLNFTGNLMAPYVITNPYLLYITKEVTPMTGEYTPLTKSLNHSRVIDDPDLLDFYNHENPKSNKRLVSYNYLWRKNTPALNTITMTKPNQYLEKTPAYIFHHLIKCGGTSLAETIENWFQVEIDRVEFSGNVNNFIKYKLNTLNLTSDNCIISHFQFDGVFLHQRYPELIEKKNEYKIFTFIRDPLNFRASLYYYTKNDEWNTGYPLEEVISNDENLISKLIPCDENNYKEVLDRYFFIGIVERMQESFDILAELLNKKKLTLPFANRSEKDDQLSKLSPEFISEFKRKNKLDYMIYDYCTEKLDETILNVRNKHT